MKVAFWITALAITVAIALAIFSEKSVRTEIMIPSSPEKVWAVLMDKDRYAQWNPVLVPLKGEIAQGNTITYQWTQGSGESIEIDSRVLLLKEQSELHQRGGTPGLLTFDHKYNLSPTESGTLVVQSEVYKGIGVLFWDASQMEPAYQRVNEALKARVGTVE